MRRYNIFELSVVETIIDGKVTYFICKQSIFPETFIEILTGKRIKVKSDLQLYPVSEYYSLLAQYNYKTGRPLKIDKKEVLRLYTEVNARKEEDKANVLAISASFYSFNILEEATLNFFNKEPKFSVKRTYKNYHRDSLIYNLYDNEWLAKALKHQEQLSFISIFKIVEYIKTSSFFEEQKQKYIKKLIQNQIKSLLNNHEDYIVDTESDVQFLFENPNCDILFRKEIVNTLSSFNIPLETIEEGIEKNLSLWLNKLILLSFNNTFQFMQTNVENPSVTEMIQTFKNKWIKLRKYEYLKAHKETIANYNPEFLAFKSSIKDVNLLKKELKELYKKIMEQLTTMEYEDSPNTRELKKKTI